MDGARWLTPEESQTWRSFLAACQAFFSSVEGQLQRDAGMPMAYYEILVRLSDAPGHSLRMSQLAEAAAASKSRASHAVARLEERGWVRRVECPTDRRGQVAELTPEGYSVLERAAPGHVEQVRRALFDNLAPGQVKQLREICEAMISAAGPAAGEGSCASAAEDACGPAGEDACGAAGEDACGPAGEGCPGDGEAAC